MPKLITLLIFLIYNSEVLYQAKIGCGTPKSYDTTIKKEDMMDNTKYELQEIMGTYYPHFLEMYINTNKLVELPKLSRSELGTFFHEWIHFIQDLTTAYGCYSAYVYFELFLSIGQKAVSQDKEIEDPIQIDNQCNVLSNLYLQHVGWGTKPEKAFSAIKCCINRNVKTRSDLVTDERIKELPRCFITTDACEEFEFGASHIMESIAYLCQCELFPEATIGHPIYPYHTASMIAELYSPEFARNRQNLIALCDVSLMNSLPGPQFVSYLARIKNGSLPLPSKPEDVYDYFLNNHNYLSSYKDICEKTRSHFKGVLRDPKAFANYRAWIDNAYDTALELRSNHPYFIIELLRDGGSLLENSQFARLFQAFGTPLIRNKIGEYNKYPLNSGSKEWDVEFMQPIKQIGNMLIKGKCSCDLKQWCIDSARELKRSHASTDLICIVDKRCDENPSLRSLDKIRCPLGFVWYALGLPLMK